MQLEIWTLLLLATCHSAPISDLIVSLPGQPADVTFRQYSGYLQASPTRQLHYWFVESQGDVQSDPLVLWLNGGPGCSSVSGLLTENGPFRVAADGRRLEMNAYSWNKIANVLYIESPGGVGFSYVTDHNYTSADEQVAAENYAAMVYFFDLFPEYRSHDFYITGESYAGIYIPMLAVLVAKNNNINFKGFAVGNGMSDQLMLRDSYVYFAASHGLLGKQLFDALQTDCCGGQNIWRCHFTEASKTNTTCEGLMDEVDEIQWFSGLNVYDLFATCAGGVPDREGSVPAMGPGPGDVDGPEDRQAFESMNNKVTLMHPEPFSIHSSAYTNMQKKFRNHDELQKEITMAIPCVNQTTSVNYLNRADVREALHIPDKVQPWLMCSTNVSRLYVTTKESLREEYLSLLARGYRLLVYNGDSDMACNFLGDQWFVKSLNQQELDPYRPWYYRADDGSKQIAGFIHTYKNINFITIKGAGHMVPTDKPLQAFIMFQNFLDNKKF